VTKERLLKANFICSENTTKERKYKKEKALLHPRPKPLTLHSVPDFLEVAGVSLSLSLALIFAVCVGEQKVAGCWMGSSMCKQ